MRTAKPEPAYVHLKKSTSRLVLLRALVALPLLSLLLLAGALPDLARNGTLLAAAASDIIYPTSPVSGTWDTSPFPPVGHFETVFPHIAKRIWVTSNSTIFLLVNDGVHRSDNGGALWQAIEGYVWSLAVSPAFEQDQTMFVGDRHDGLRLSQDGGYSWRSPAQPVTDCVRDIAVSPQFRTDRTVYAATSRLWVPGGQLVRSTDGGEHWQGVFDNGVAVERVLLSPSFQVDHTVFIVTWDGALYRSNDGGASWVRADAGLGIEHHTFIRSLAISPDYENDARLFAATGFSGELNGVFESTDGGQTWHQITPTGIRSLAIAPDFASSRTLFGIGDQQVLRSVDGGRNWQSMLTTVDFMSEVVLSPNYSRNRTVYALATNSLQVSTDGGVIWRVVAARSATCVPLDQIVASPDFANDGTVFAGRGPICKSTDAGQSWSTINLPEQERAVLALSPAFASDHAILAALGNHLYKSADGGNQWSGVITLPFGTVARQEQMVLPAEDTSQKQTGSSPPFSWDDVLRLSPNYATDRTIFVTRYGRGLFRSTDDGATWQRLAENLEPWVTDLAISPGYPADPTLYLSVRYNGIFRSDDGGATWTLKSPPTFPLDPDVELSPMFNSDHTLFVSAKAWREGGAYRSEDRGDSWIDITGGVLGGYVTQPVISPRFAQDRTLIIGRRYGALYMSEDAGNTWFPLKGIPVVYDDLQQHGLNGLTHGLTIAYRDNVPLPMASTPESVYLYHWPKLLPLSQVSVGLEPGSQEVMSVPLPLKLDTYAPATWETREESLWLAVTPVTGTWPTIPTLTIDPRGLTEPVTTTISVDAHWSSRQGVTATVPVKLWFIHSRLWLPFVSN